MRIQISTNSTKNLIWCPYPTLHNFFSVSQKLFDLDLRPEEKLSQLMDCPLPTNNTHI
jgi:hypothetical protein